MANQEWIPPELNHEEVAQKIYDVENILAGPWVGEFGWELFCFQGYLRKLKDDYPHIKSFNIISRTGRSVIYEDFCDQYIEWDCPGKDLTGALCLDWAEMPKDWIEDIIKSLNLTNVLWIPTQQFVIQYHASGPRYEEYLKLFKERQRFIQYGIAKPELKYDVVIHARSTDKYHSGNRNWSTDKWHQLGNSLIKQNLKIACIGIEDEAIHIPGSDNLMNIPLEQTADILASSSCIVGTSSGPMHFASLCGCPQILISECVESGGKDNERRYKYDWNPLGTPVHLVKYENSQEDNGWNPPVNKVEELINDILF